MKTTFAFTLDATMVITLVMGTITEVNLSQLESRILNGQRAEGEHRYMASLQLDNRHVCSSGMFQRGFLLTTLNCGKFIEEGIVMRSGKGTAVLGSLELSTGQRVNIDTIRYTVHGRISSYHVAVIEYSMMCGWGTVENDDTAATSVGNASSSTYLHCMFVVLASVYICRPSIGIGDFRSKLICGVAENPKQAPTLGDVGSPLIASVRDGKKQKQFIIGVTLDRFDGINGTFLRFIRSSFIFPFIKKLTEEGNSGFKEKSDCISSNGQEVIDEQCKRRKYE